MLVSIVINNFNYGGFLADAIESALAQEDAITEIVVVDDGSTDESRAVLAGYADRVRIVLKDNGGQASAYNAGFEACHGEAVIFLDADDRLAPHTAARVAAAFDAEPSLSKVHFRLEVVDEGGRPTGEAIPPAHVQLPTGDLRLRVLRSPDDVPYPPGSGNAYSARVLKRLLPIDEAAFGRVLADVYLVNLAALLGPVGALAEPGGSYRVHARNLHYSAGVDLTRIRSTIRATAATHVRLAEIAGTLDTVSAKQLTFSSVTDLALRLISLRLDPAAHPLERDRPAALALKGIRAAGARDDLRPGIRFLYELWFLSAALAPRSLTAWLARRLLSAWRTGRP